VQANNTQFAGILAETCVCPSFDHETTSNRGWLYNQKVPEVLLIDFNKSSLLMVYKALCSLEPTSTGQTDVSIKGRRWHVDMGAPLELREWLSRYVLGF
jgi:hypothetical protein